MAEAACTVAVARVGNATKTNERQRLQTWTREQEKSYRGGREREREGGEWDGDRGNRGKQINGYN